MINSETNRLGLTKKDYQGSPSTLCTGCGHDQITNHIINALYQLHVHPYQVVKTSGIGCSSKTPAYFLSRSFGINFIHGRMAPLATGSVLVNPSLIHIGISGDGDTASIGLGGFIHLVRRNVPMVYIVANNGVYGLTKGQFSATSDIGSQLKTGEINPFETVDICALALEVGGTFVARSFSGDLKQMVTLLKAALKHKGTAVIDVISPCVTFNNHDGSTKSFSYMKEHDIRLHELGFIPADEPVVVDYPEGATEHIVFADGSRLVLEKIDSLNHDVHDRLGAIKLIHEGRKKGHVITGLFYIDETRPDLVEVMGLRDGMNLRDLTEAHLRGADEDFEKVLSQFS
ncbi:MAG: 2-oxoacid:ferredoxin oxidoreductase subunit beta [Pseudobdellovibrionaceae bacterium]|nr:2-oxoacid:ferredoxin oxidoreductase subunit beta [Pseudobdellovibrionaceae bacterium]